jgi:hypothetical protein
MIHGVLASRVTVGEIVRMVDLIPKERTFEERATYFQWPPPIGGCIRGNDEDQ